MREIKSFLKKNEKRVAIADAKFEVGNVSNSQLILHCGASEATREQVGSVVTPSATESFQPISHLEFFHQVESALVGDNFTIVNEAHALSREGNRYFGLLQIADRQRAAFTNEAFGPGAAVRADDDYGYVVGLRNSHDKSYATSLAVGSRVFVCDNLSFSGEVTVSRKHTTFIARDLPGLTARAIGKLGAQWVAQEERFNAYKGYELGDKDAHDLLIKLLDCRSVTAQQIPHVLREWRTPRHPEFAAAGKTAWRLFNAVTEISKERGGIWNLPARTNALHGIMDQAVGILQQAN